MLDQAVRQTQELCKVNGTILVNVKLLQEVLEAFGFDLVSNGVQKRVQLAAVDSAIAVPIKGVEAFLEVFHLLGIQGRGALIAERDGGSRIVGALVRRIVDALVRKGDRD